MLSSPLLCYYFGRCHISKQTYEMLLFYSSGPIGFWHPGRITVALHYRVITARWPTAPYGYSSVACPSLFSARMGRAAELAIFIHTSISIPALCGLGLWVYLIQWRLAGRNSAASLYYIPSFFMDGWLLRAYCSRVFLSCPALHNIHYPPGSALENEGLRPAGNEVLCRLRPLIISPGLPLTWLLSSPERRVENVRILFWGFPSVSPLRRQPTTFSLWTSRPQQISRTFCIGSTPVSLDFRDDCPRKDVV